MPVEDCWNSDFRLELNTLLIMIHSQPMKQYSYYYRRPWRVTQFIPLLHPVGVWGGREIPVTHVGWRIMAKSMRGLSFAWRGGTTLWEIVNNIAWYIQLYAGEHYDKNNLLPSLPHTTNFHCGHILIPPTNTYTHTHKHTYTHVFLIDWWTFCTFSSYGRKNFTGMSNVSKE